MLTRPQLDILYDDDNLVAVDKPAGTLTIPVVYLVGRHVGGRRIAAAASILAALSPALIWYSQEARAYAVLVLLCACGRTRRPIARP